MIPARAGSKRLPSKNTALLLGKPLLAYAIETCMQSMYVDQYYVSTEDIRTADMAREYGAEVLDRPKELAGSSVPTQAVMKHFAESLTEFDIIAAVQANSPQVNFQNVDKAIELLVDNNLREVRSVNSEGLETGAIWIATREAIAWNGLSVYFGVVEENAIDIHTAEDLKRVEEMMRGESVSQ